MLILFNVVNYLQMKKESLIEKKLFACDQKDPHYKGAFQYPN